MVKGADLEVPWIAHEGELEKGREIFLRQHFPCGDDPGMTGKLRPQAVPREMAESVAGPGQVIHRVPPAQAAERGPDAGSAGLGDMHKEETVTMRQQHTRA